MSEPLVKGTKAWSENIRREARLLMQDLEVAHLTLGRLLYEVSITPVDGVEGNPPVYTAWGYESYREYAEHELGLHVRKANFLRNIYYTLYVSLQDLAETVRQRILALGYSKVRTLVGVLSVENAERWLERAEKLTFVELQAVIAQYRQQLAEEKRKAKDEGKDPAAVVAEVPEQAAMEVIVERFGLYPEQQAVVDEALRIAGDISGSDKRGHNLTLICMDYMATNGAAPPGAAAFAHYLSTLENIFQVRFMAVNAQVQPHELLYGFKALEDLFASRGLSTGVVADPPEEDADGDVAEDVEDDADSASVGASTFAGGNGHLAESDPAFRGVAADGDGEDEDYSDDDILGRDWSEDDATEDAGL